MKKYIIGIFQVITYCLIYEITVWTVYGIWSALLKVLGNIPILSVLCTESFINGTTFSLCPALSAIVIVVLMGLIFKKTKLYIIPTIVIFAILLYTNITNMISVAVNYGIISWDFANVAWSSIILCGIIIFGLFGNTNYKITKVDPS